MARTQASTVGRKYVGEQSIPTTVTWSGTPPTGETKLYNWSQDFATRMVFVSAHLIYTGAGTSNTTVEFALPSDLPSPVVNTGLTGASVVLYPGSMEMITSVTGGTGAASKCYVRRNGANTGFSILGITGAAVAAKYVAINIWYYF